MPRAWINDGLTIEETVRPVRRNTLTGDFEPDDTQPELKIVFRPPLSTTFQKYIDEPPGLNAERKIDNLHKFIHDHLVSWDNTDDNDKPVPLPPKLPEFSEMLSHVPAPYLNAIERAMMDGSTKVREVQKK